MTTAQYPLLAQAIAWLEDAATDPEQDAIGLALKDVVEDITKSEFIGATVERYMALFMANRQAVQP